MKNTVGIIDIGSARTKLLIVSDDVILTTKKFKFETKLASYLNNNIIEQEGVQAIEVSLKECFKVFLENNVKDYIIVATEALRQAENGNEILNRFEKEYGAVNLLDTNIEGAVFYSSIKNLNNDSFCLIDIGGGSVQIVWGGNKVDIHSIETGTYLLEKKFQKEFPPTTKELDNMANYIKDKLDSVSHPNNKIDKIIFGSNCMEDFIKEVTAALDLDINYKEFTIEECQKVLDSISSKSFDTIKLFYPSNPFFMYGADKALINLITIARWMNVKKLSPTNNSLSLGMAELLMKRPKILSDLNIQICSFEGEI